MHSIFPCFDQPNIRAPFQLSVIYPQSANLEDSWVVVSNESELEIFEVSETEFPFFHFKKNEKNKMFTKFNCTKPLPAYLYSLFAGNYKVISNFENRVPMRIICTQESERFAQKQAAEIFNITKLSLSFLENYLKVPFPFAKYD
jgi:aminopeptidase N